MKKIGRLADELATYLRDRIISGEIAGGSTLAEATLAAEYDVARPTARAAIELLALRGLVTRKPHLPAVVNSVPREDIPEILSLLETTERLALEQILMRDPDARPLRRALESSTYFLLDEMVELSGSERLVQVHRRMTYELILAQLGGEAAFVDDAEARDALVRAVLELDGAAASAALDHVQALRRAASVVSETVGQ